MDVGAISAASVATTASYRSFADATRSVLDLLERLMPGCALYLSHLDRAHSGIRRSSRSRTDRVASANDRYEAAEAAAAALIAPTSTRTSSSLRGQF